MPSYCIWVNIIVCLVYPKLNWVWDLPLPVQGIQELLPVIIHQSGLMSEDIIMLIRSYGIRPPVAFVSLLELSPVVLQGPCELGPVHMKCVWVCYVQPPPPVFILWVDYQEHTLLVHSFRGRKCQTSCQFALDEGFLLCLASHHGTIGLGLGLHGRWGTDVCGYLL